jgi:hypothetical protein
VKRKRLKVDDAEIRDKARLYSIASSESDIRICYILNQILDIDLSLAEDIVIQNKNLVLKFRNYYYESDHGTEKYYLIINRSDSNFLFPELKKVDYIFMTIADTIISGMESSIQKIKSQAGISAIIPIESGKIKSFNKIKL